MKFGKLPSVNHINFQLPEVPKFTQEYLTKVPKKSSNIYLGCTGWSMKEWVGKVYPKGTKANEYLEFYGKQFNTIELNTTHYRIPTIETIEKWKDTVAENFKFCPKVFQKISHSKDFGVSSNSIEHFKNNISQLNEYLGPCFIQFPPYFGIEHIKQLEYFFNQWGTNIPLAVEVRHSSWFDHPDHTTQLFDLLHQHQKGIVITDVAGRRDVLHMGITAPYAMVRWVGNGLVDSDYERLDEWAKIIENWVSQGLNEIYFFLHEPDNILAPEITLYLAQKLSGILKNTNILVPQIPYEDETPQLKLF